MSDGTARLGPRSAGLVLHPTSLPGKFGIGDFGPEAEESLRWAASAGLRIWQVLPLGPPGHNNPPYAALSAFAGNPLLISPERLLQEELLPPAALDGAFSFPPDHVDFSRVIPWKEALLRQSWEHFRRHASGWLRGDYETFTAAPEQIGWLPEWALFSALKIRNGGRDWLSFPAEIRHHDPAAIASAKRDLAEEIAYATYVQFLFFRQWKRLKSFASELGIRVLGDIPIYLAFDSADVWSNQRLFSLDADGRPLSVSGVPPDCYSTTGQLWGNPLYRWDRMEEEGYAWWIERLRANFRLADLVRIDHFRGFSEHWEVPAGETTAVNGRWASGPGSRLFDAIRAALGDLPIIAEDLGHITEDVRALRDSQNFPGMKILQFAFGEANSEHMPHRHVSNAIVYTGTHDNDTTRGWFATLDADSKARALACLGGDGSKIEWDLIRAAYGSVAHLAIVPAQDLFGLGSEARMNTPGEVEGHWDWRATSGMFRSDLASRLRRLAELTGRV